MTVFFSRNEKFCYIVLMFFLVVWFLYHLITLSISPLPNFDEVFFTNISDNLCSKGGLYLSIGIIPGENVDHVIAYGPVYFYLHSIIIKIFGLNIISGRLISLFSGFFILVFFLFFSKNIFQNVKYVFGVIVLLITDYKFNMNMHSGRMDLLAVLFFMISLYFIFNLKSFLNSTCAGIFISLSFLTTPRISFYFIGLAFLFIYDIFSGRRDVYKYLTIGVVSSLIIFSWIYFQFGSVEYYINYMGNLRNYGAENTSAINKHLGFNGLSFHLINPSFILLYIISGFLFYYKKFEKISLSVFILVLAHVIFILEQASYSAMILPFVYWLVVYGLIKFENIKPLNSYLRKALFAILLFNIVTFSFKSFFILMSREERNINYVEQKLMSFDISKQNVLANFEYFYFVNEKQGNYTSIELVNEKLNHINLNKFNYAILDLATAAEFENKFANHIKEKILLKNKGKRDSFFSDLVSRKINVYLSYDGYFYVLKQSLK